MGQLLLEYKRPDPTTWVYMSSFLTIGLFFVFHRFWSIRNLDILLLILLAPGLLMVHEGYRRQLVQSETVAKLRAESEKEKRDPNTVDPNSPSTVKPVSSLTTAIPMLAVATIENSTGISEIEKTPPSQEVLTSNLAQTESEISKEGFQPVNSETQERSFSLEPTPTNDVEQAPSYPPTDIRRWGFVYLFLLESFLLIRLLLDPLMVRRPLLDPNLSVGGLNFIGISLFIFMMANVVASTPRNQVTQGPALGPGYAMMNLLPAIPTQPVRFAPGESAPPSTAELTPSQTRLANIAKTLAIFAHLAIVIGIVLIANRHFSNLKAGIGCATLYLLLPYTAQMTGRVDHALPAALLLWAVLWYRKPMIAGIFLGLAGGLVYYPLFLLPLWFSFYWNRGLRPFAVGVIAMLALLMLALSLDNSATSLTEHLQRMFGILNPNKDASELRGIWGLGWSPIWRLPVIVAFVILSVFFSVWPAQKNLGSLISGSAALMVAAQFWHGYGGGLYIAWFLPLVLLTVFRPNLQDRIASKVVVSGTKGTSATSSGPELETV